MRLAVLLLLIAPLTGVAAAQESFDGAWRGVITNAVRHLTPAIPYTYRIKARFEGSKGVGTRLDVRQCDFTFTEQ